MAVAYLSLGSNIGESKDTLQKAVEKIHDVCGEVIRQSSIFISEPWGFESEHPFLNIVIEIITSQAPLNLLKTTQEIENRLGRIAKSVDKTYEDRIIDIDILYYDQHKQHSSKLTIPHALLHERRFVLEPLCEIAPAFNHPIYNLTSLELLEACEDRSEVKKEA